MKTQKGVKLSMALWSAGLAWINENDYEVISTVSLICRKSATYVRLHEWLASGHPTLGGDYINENRERLDAQDEKLERELDALGATLAGLVTQGAPVLNTHSLYGVTVTVTDHKGHARDIEMTE